MQQPGAKLDPAIWATASAALLIAAGAAWSPPPSPAAAAGLQRPNVIVVLTDDQTVSELTPQAMPRTVELLAEHGTSFSSSIVSSPLCCPSRAGDLTGQYPHNDGVIDNEPGYPSLIDKGSTLYSWLAGAGYRTGHLGRFLLNYDRQAPPGAGDDTHGGFDAPPGVEHWFGYVGSATFYHGATFSRNGAPVELPGGRRGYSTRAINHEALDFVRAARSDPRPFFLTVAQLAPHASATPEGAGPCGVGGLPVPDGGRLGQFADAPLPKPPSFDEPRIGDKPAWVRSRPKLGSSRRHGLKLGWRCANASLETVDKGVAALVAQLRRQGELDQTAIFFTSDNGYLFGEHRVFLNKVYPYEESIRVPLLARVPARLIGRKPSRRPPAEIPALVNNLDLTATILDLAHTSPCAAGGDCRVLDGHSLVPLLRGRRPGWSRGRALLFQLGGVRACGTATAAAGLNTFYDAVRTKRRVYVELNRLNRDTGECDRPEYELYDLKQDPYELRNRAVDPTVRSPSAEQATMARRLAALRSCAGIAGRDAPSDRPFCE